MKLKITAIILVLVMGIAMLVGCTGGEKPEGGKEPSGEKINAKIVLVLEDKTEVPYDITVSSGLTIREALAEAGLISEEEAYAMFVSDIDGHVADVLNDGVTWMPSDADGNFLPPDTKDQVVTTFDSIIVDEGETIYLVYYVVPNFDD